MVKNFWQTLAKPILVLAPMANVTDAAFRRIIARYGKPPVIWTEFVAADGLCHPDGRKRLLRDLIYSESERPIVAQLFGANPAKMEQAAALVQELGFDGLDLNFGCPDKTIEKQGAGAALIKNPKLAREIVRAAKRGAPNLPVSVKTRVGYNKDELDTWLPELLAEEPAVLTLHARTRKEMSKVPARWNDVARAVKIRNDLKSPTLIFGNGDLIDLADAKQKVAASGADGAMLGRAIFGNPWLFSQDAVVCSRSEREMSDQQHPDLRERLRVMVEHTKLFDELLGGPSADGKSFAVMKKHYKAYVAGFPQANEPARTTVQSGGLRAKLMETENVAQVSQIIDEFLAELDR